jgi:hypothetical protein
VSVELNAHYNEKLDIVIVKNGKSVRYISLGDSTLMEVYKPMTTMATASIRDAVWCLGEFRGALYE